MAAISITGITRFPVISSTINTIKQLDLEDISIAVGILFTAVMHAKTAFTSGLGGRHVYFWYNMTFGDITENTTEQLELENGFRR